MVFRWMETVWERSFAPKAFGGGSGWQKRKGARSRFGVVHFAYACHEPLLVAIKEVMRREATFLPGFSHKRSDPPSRPFVLVIPMRT